MIRLPSLFRLGLILIGFSGLLPALLRAEPVDFNVPAGPAATALLEFSRQAKVEVLFSYDELARIQSNAVIGSFEPADALALLLRGTGFGAARNRRGKFSVTANRAATGVMRGRLLAPDGSPAPQVNVTVPAIHASVLTNENGEFTFTHLAPGLYHVFAGATNYRTLEIAGAKVVADQVTVLETQTLQAASDPTRLEPFIVHDKSGRDETFDRSHTPLIPPTATGNLDLSRTENDSLPYQIFDRKQITRSGVVNLNEFLQREVLEGDLSADINPEQSGQLPSYQAGGTNLNLRGYGSDETVVLVNGRRLPEVLTSAGSSAVPPDVSLIPVSLVEQIEVLPVSTSALYSGNPVGGVINIVLRPTVEVTELTTTYTNALAHFDAPQSSVSLQNGQSLLGGKLRIRLSATLTHSTPATEAELHHIASHDPHNAAVDAPIFRATPNVRAADPTVPLFAGSSATVTSVAPGADGQGGLAAFAGRVGLRNYDLYTSSSGLVASVNSSDYPYGREQRRASYFLSTTYDLTADLQLGLDATYAQTVVRRGYDDLRGDLLVSATSPLNPFPGHDVRVSLLETTPALGSAYNEARFNFYSVVGGALLQLPSEWSVSADSQYTRNVTTYRGIGGADPDRWQALVDAGGYNPFRDTQVYGPPTAFYDQVLTYRGARGQFVTVGDYDTLDSALRVANHSLMLPTGNSVLNLGTDYRRVHLGSYVDERRFADGTLSSRQRTTGRTLQRVSLFGELQTPFIPTNRLPAWIEVLEAELAVRYIVADTSRETNVAPTVGFKAEFPHGFTLRGSFTTSNRVPTPQLSLPVSDPGSGTPGVSYATITDPKRNGEQYDVPFGDAPSPNLRPESAISQTAGLIYKIGKAHRLRASLDFVDTRKTNEVQVLDARSIVLLEGIFPDRVIRSSYPDGKITQVVTGAVNLASRHSQNWNLSLDYSEAEFLGGTVDAYARLIYFQQFDVQLSPGAATVDELSHPDATSLSLLRYRANFGLGWTGPRYGFGIDGHYFHSRILPPALATLQNNDRVKLFMPFDAYAQSDLTHWLPWHGSRYGLRGQIRVNNLFGTNYPRFLGSDVNVQPYGDWRGRTYSISLTATF